MLAEPRRNHGLILQTRSAGLRLEGRADEQGSTKPKAKPEPKPKSQPDPQPRRQGSGTHAIVMIMQMANALLMERYFGNKDEMSLPAGRTFSNTHENSAE